MVRTYLVALLISELIVLFLLPSVGIDFSHFLIISLLEDTVAVSSFVFAVTGIWLGIANPQVMSDLFRTGYSIGASGTEAKKFSLIFLPLKFSIVNICLSLIFLAVARIAENIKSQNGLFLWIYENLMLMIALMATMIVIFSIVATMIPAYIIQQNAKSAAVKNEAFEQTTKHLKRP